MKGSMQATRKIDKKTGLVTITISGEVDLLPAIKTAADDMLHDPDFRPGADALWDLRKAEMRHLSTEDILSLVSFIKGHQQERGAGYKVAIVVERDLLFGGARMFEAFSDTVPFSCRVFRDLDEAQGWISGKL
jgi:hypothetical protein